MRFYDIGESPLMGHSEKHIAPLLLGGIIAAGRFFVGNDLRRAFKLVISHHISNNLLERILLCIAHFFLEEITIAHNPHRSGVHAFGFAV